MNGKHIMLAATAMTLAIPCAAWAKPGGRFSAIADR